MKLEEIIKNIEKNQWNGLSKKSLIAKLSNSLSVNTKEAEKIIWDAEDAGELFLEKNKKFFTRKHLGYKIGTISGNQKGYAFCTFEGAKKDEDVFIAAPNLNGALHNDKVAVFVKKNNYDGRMEGVVVKVLEHGVKTVVGTIQVFDKFAFVVPDNKRIISDVFVPREKINNAKDGDKVYVKIDSYKGKSLSGEVVEILGKVGDVTSDVLSIIRSYDLIEEFSDELLNQVKSIPQKIDIRLYPDHKDIRDLLLFTIDGEDAKDFDDAVSLELQDGMYNLGVHIADVGEYVKVGSLLDKEAFNRGTSVYFPNMVLPMLPRELSNGICSLNPNEDRLALSVFMQIDEYGKVKSHQIMQTVINSNERMTYDKVTKILEGDAELRTRYKNITPTLELMAKLTLILEKVRKKRGSIDFDIPEPKIILNPQTLEVEKLSERPRTISERLIESFMLLTNETVAEHFKKAGIPFVYRIHESPEREKLENFNHFIAGLGLSLPMKGAKVEPREVQEFMEKLQDTDLKDVVNSVLLRSMQKAKYSPDNLGHFGLAAEFYCHFTSPIRRYPDLTIHRIIKSELRKQLNEGKKQRLKEFVEHASTQSSTREVLAERAERDVDDYFKARYMQNKVGEMFDGVVSGVTSYGMFVELDNTVEGYVSLLNLPGGNYQFDEKRFTLSNNAHRFVLGQKVRVRVMSVNLQEREIDFSLVLSGESTETYHPKPSGKAKHYPKK